MRESGATVRERWRWAGLVIVSGFALLFAGAFIQSRTFPSGINASRQSQVVFQLVNILQISTGLFLGLFAALHCHTLIDLRIRRAGSRALLARLAAELALLPDREPPGHGYRDPLRLAMPPHVLASDPFHPDEDADLLLALLALQGAVGRYNDLVLTSALVLAEGQSFDADATASRYWRAARDAAMAVRALLAERGIHPPRTP